MATSNGTSPSVRMLCDRVHQAVAKSRPLNFGGSAFFALAGFLAGSSVFALIRKHRRLHDAYRFPGFRPHATVRGIFGDPKARILRMERREKTLCVACGAGHPAPENDNLCLLHFHLDRHECGWYVVDRMIY